MHSIDQFFSERSHITSSTNRLVDDVISFENLARSRSRTLVCIVFIIQPNTSELNAERIFSVGNIYYFQFLLVHEPLDYLYHSFDSNMEFDKLYETVLF